MAASSSSKTQAKGWAGGEDDVELALEVVRELDHVRDHKGRVQAGLGGQEPGLLDAALGDVDPGHPGPAPGPGERVQPEMALQVEQVLAGDIADLVDQERVQVDAAARLPALDVVELRADVDRRPLVPEGAVGGDTRVHARSLPRDGAPRTAFVVRQASGGARPGVGSPNPKKPAAPRLKGKSPARPAPPGGHRPRVPRRLVFDGRLTWFPGSWQPRGGTPRAWSCQ